MALHPHPLTNRLQPLLLDCVPIYLSQLFGFNSNKTTAFTSAFDVIRRNAYNSRKIISSRTLSVPESSTTSVSSFIKPICPCHDCPSSTCLFVTHRSECFVHQHFSRAVGRLTQQGRTKPWPSPQTPLEASHRRQGPSWSVDRIRSRMQGN